jgi:predicted nucleic acid-binding protein
MIHLDTNTLIESMVAGSTGEAKVLNWLTNNETIGISAIAWSEFLCGPLTSEDEMLARLLPGDPEPFLAIDASKAAELFNATGRRSRSLADCQIAATAIRLSARDSTANHADFAPFIPFGLALA